jgi:hypothetical protein
MVDIVDNGLKAVDTVLKRASDCKATPTLDAYDLIFMDVQVRSRAPHDDHTCI